MTVAALGEQGARKRASPVWRGGVGALRELRPGSLPYSFRHFRTDRPNRLDRLSYIVGRPCLGDRETLAVIMLTVSRILKNMKDAQAFQMIANCFKIIYTMFSSVFLIWIMEEAFMERLLTTEEVAELLRIDPVTVRRLVMRGELIGYRIAGEYRFTEAGVE